MTATLKKLVQTFFQDMQQKIISGVFFTFSSLDSRILFTTAITILITLSSLHKWLVSTGPVLEEEDVKRYSVKYKDTEVAEERWANDKIIGMCLRSQIDSHCGIQRFYGVEFSFNISDLHCPETRIDIVKDTMRRVRVRKEKRER